MTGKEVLPSILPYIVLECQNHDVAFYFSTYIVPFAKKLNYFIQAVQIQGSRISSSGNFYYMKVNDDSLRHHFTTYNVVTLTNAYLPPAVVMQVFLVFKLPQAQVNLLLSNFNGLCHYCKTNVIHFNDEYIWELRLFVHFCPFSKDRI